MPHRVSAAVAMVVVAMEVAATTRAGAARGHGVATRAAGVARASGAAPLDTATGSVSLRVWKTLQQNCHM